MEDKNDDEFYRTSRQKSDGSYSLRSICKSCCYIESSKRLKKNPEKSREYALKCYHKHAEKYLEAQKNKRLSFSESEKQIQRIKSKNYREKNKEILREKWKEKYDPNKNSLNWNKYYYENREREIQRKRDYNKNLSEDGKKRVCRNVKNWQKNNPEKVKAHSKIYWATKTGKISRPQSCDLCFISCKPSAHHHDYTKPFDVKWLCKDCHAIQHRKFD